MHAFVSTASEMAVGTYKQILPIHIYAFSLKDVFFYLMNAQLDWTLL